VLGKRVLGKPESARDAAWMLGLLSGRTHTVLTGYCVLRLTPAAAPRRAGAVARRSVAGARPRYGTHLLVRVVTSRVRMRKLSARDIAAYVRTGEPMDKAGAYAAQGIGMALIESLSGSYSNVVGLPICQLMQDLELRFGVRLFGNAGGKGGAR
jgi:septum formation protein